MKYKMTIKKELSMFSARVYYNFELYEQRKILWINYWTLLYNERHNNDNRGVDIDDLIKSYNIKKKLEADRKADDAQYPIEVIKECE